MKSHSATPWFSYQFLIDIETPDLPLFHFWNNSLADSSTSYNGGDLVTGSWYFLVGVREGTALKYYLNGSDNLTWQNDIPGEILDTDGPLFIGGNAFIEGTEGAIDEVRLNSVARSPDWIKMCYMNQLSTSNLIVFTNN